MQQINLDVEPSKNNNKQQPQKRSMNNSSDDLSYSGMNAAPIPKKSAMIKTSKPRPHVCSTCTRAFARLEHLKRHERSHTNEKPFQCAACGRCFARRDLVLRHQQKLHASLPTNNRSNIQRKGRSQKVIPKDGEIVPDYLNDNINIVRNNTSAKLPLPNKLNNDVSANNNLNDNSHDNMNSNSCSSNTPSTDSSSFSRNNSSHNQPTLQNQTVFNSSLLGANVYNSPPSAGFTMSPNLFGLNQSKQQQQQQQAQHLQTQQQQQQQQHFETISPISQQQQNQQHIQPQPFDNQTSATRHDELNSDELDSDIDFDIHQFDTPQAMYSNDLYENASNQGNFRNHRHASFSAAASGSYTGFPDSTHEQDKMLTQIENEAPQQVRFSSPQLKHQSNGDFSYLDMDMLDNLDLDNLNDLGIDFNAINASLNQQQHQQQQLKKEHQTLHQHPQQPHQQQQLHQQQQQQQLHRASLFNNNTKSLFNYKAPVINTLNNNDLPKVVPNPQTEATLQRVLSHPQSDATIQRVLSHPHSEVALQKVLSHPQSEVALQRVFSHPQPEVALQSVLSHPSDTDWFNEFINAPIETDFPIITDHIGFTDASKNDSSSTPSPSKFQNVTSPSNDLSQFFRLRQIDLSKHIPHHHENPTIPGRCSEKVRQHIINKYHLKLSQFPQLDDLNHYLALYETEFNKYFPFIHIPSLNIEEKYDQIPLLLSMAAIGALYSFHARNSSTLFNFSRFLIHNFMENQMNLNHFNDIPLYITQALLLHMFLGMFHNDAEVTKLTARQLTSLVSLVKTTKLDMPLETIILPPSITSDLVLSSSNANSKFLKSCHDYFILSQSRIRTVHVLHYLCVLFACLTDTNVELTAENIRCGSPCTIEELWKAKSCNEWLNILQDHKITIDSKFSLIRVSNGTNTYRDLWRDLTNLSLDKDVGLRGLLSLLLSLNGFIHKESKDLEASNKTEGAKIAQWRMDERPYMESLIKIWESCFIRNGGVLVPRGQNLHAINRSCVLKLILPLLSFAKINKCVYLSTVLSKVWISDWNGMNVEIKKLTRDMEALRDSINYSLDIINLWIEIISITNDAEKTSVRTPIFFLTCLFTSTLLISEYLYTTEVWANNYLTMPDKFTELTTADRVLWLRAETVFKKVEKNLLPSGSNNSSYSEFLRIQAKGALDVDILDDEIARLALEPGDLKPIAEIIISGRLSSRCLGLGVRILADAPVWPVALVFAEALKARATHIHNCTSSWSPMTKVSPK